ncbi:FAD-dependent oxidoreductase [Streptomyces sp. NPDC048248]|uniref:FAD-dependent oxidoreductase n=1 Tax=Streptomyces sp. NPDC048248 TaxID=3365523 RepID=UPI003720136D
MGPEHSAPDAEALPFETPDINGAFPRLTPEQIDFLDEHGERRAVAGGELLFREGEPFEEFLVILSGSVTILEAYGTPDEHIIRAHGPGRFLGELGLLQGQPAFYTAQVHQAGEVLAMPVDGLRRLVAQEPVIGDLILRAYLARRSLLVGQRAGFRILGSRYSPDTRRLREFAARNRLPHRWIDLETDQEAEELLRRFGIAPEDTPIVIWREEQLLRNPSDAELARLIGLGAPAFHESVGDLLIIGSGPAGLASAVYAASEGLNTTAVDAIATGGQAGTSSRIENYLGFPSGISGAELADRAVVQAHKFGARIVVPTEGAGLEPVDGHYRVAFADGSEAAGRSVVLATGARYRRLPVPGIERLEGAGVYYAATLYEAMECRMDPLAVVGGGNSAGQAVLFLAGYSPRVFLVIRGEALGANMSRYLVDQIERHPRVNVLTNAEVRDVLGKDTLEALVVEDSRTGERRELDARALFIFIGAQPCTAWLPASLALDSRGFILTGREAEACAVAERWEGRGRGCLPLETSLPGVFASGDVRSGSVKRVASAVGEGAMAVQLVHRYLGSLRGAAGTN